MANTLERFKIKGLYGSRDIDARIRDNTLILVGENGSGKTTFLRILFYLLSGRWLSLVQFQFDDLSVTISGKTYSITHNDVVNAFKETDRRAFRDVPPPLRRRIMEAVEKGDIDQLPIEAEHLMHRYGISPHEVFRQMEFFDEKSKGKKKALQDTIKEIQSSVGAKVLYLPTYRRIERELGSIFEGVDPDDFRRQKGRIRQQSTLDSYIELVEFGMKDVELAVKRTVEALKEFSRESLNNLTLRYLGDVVNREYQNVGLTEIADVSEGAIRAVLNRIHESILTDENKDHLFNVINSARKADEPTEHEKIIYHYFLKLLGFQEALKQKERQITEFCGPLL